MEWIDIKDLKRVVNSHRLALFTFFIPWGLYFFILWPRILVQTSSGLLAGHPYVWADWSMHIALAANFAFRPIQHWFDSLPVYAGAPVTYPFITNLISGLLWKAGVSLPSAFIIPSFMFTALALIALYTFFGTVLKSKSQAILASWLALLSGGIGFFIMLSELGWPQVLDSTVNLTQIPERQIEVNTIVASMFVPQRAFLLGLPVGLGILSVLIQIFVLKTRKASYATLISIGLLAGLLPLIHTHTFLVVVLFSFWAFFYSFRLVKAWIWYGVPAIILSFVVYWVFLRRGISAGVFFSWRPGWMEQSSVLEWVLFWWRNWGLFLPLAGIGTILIAKARKLPVLWSVLFFWTLFTVSNLIQFQPQLWDNTKLFAWVYIGLSIPVVTVLFWLYRQKGQWSKVVVGILVFVLTISGGVDLLHNLSFEHKTFSMLSQDQIKLGEFVRKTTPSDAVFLTRPLVSNPVSMMGGRSVLLGYPGWAFSYGLSFAKREGQIKSSLDHSLDPQVLKRLNVTHIYLQKSDPSYARMQSSEILHRLFSNSDGTVFQFSTEDL